METLVCVSYCWFFTVLVQYHVHQGLSTLFGKVMDKPYDYKYELNESFPQFLKI